MKPYRIGLLGGIGPAATGTFYNLIITKLQQSGHVVSNADFPQVIINSIPAPELTAAEVTNEDLSSYVEGVTLLESLRPDLIFMICNTIHVYFDEMKRRSGAKNLISIRDCVGEKMKERYAGKNVCILGTPMTIAAGLYDFPFLQYVNPHPDELKELGSIIDAYNVSGDPAPARQRLEKIISAKLKCGAGVFLCGCTEMSVLAPSITGPAYVDPLDIVSDFIIAEFLRYRTKVH